MRPSVLLHSKAADLRGPRVYVRSLFWQNPAASDRKPSPTAEVVFQSTPRSKPNPISSEWVHGRTVGMWGAGMDPGSDPIAQASGWRLWGGEIWRGLLLLGLLELSASCLFPLNCPGYTDQGWASWHTDTQNANKGSNHVFPSTLRWPQAVMHWVSLALLSCGLTTTNHYSSLRTSAHEGQGRSCLCGFRSDLVSWTRRDNHLDEW